MPTIMIDGKKHTPGSNTLKRMKAKAAQEAAAKAAKKPAAAAPKAKPPVPATRSKPPVPVTMSAKTAALRKPVPGIKPLVAPGKSAAAPAKKVPNMADMYGSNSGKKMSVGDMYGSKKK